MSATYLPEYRFIPNLNAENKELQSEVHTLEGHVAHLDVDHSRALERVSVISDHLKMINQELQHTRSLSEAGKQGVETESHMKALADNEQGRLDKELRRMERELAAVKKTMDKYESDMYRDNTKISELKSRMKLHDQATQEWIAASKRRDEDAMLLNKYAAADDTKTKDLQLKLEKEEELALEERGQLDKTATELVATQVANDKLSEQFRQLQKERGEIYAQWDSTVRQMARRDGQIDSTAIRVAEKRADIKDTEQEIRRKQWFLEQELENNREQEKVIQRQEKTVARTRLDMQQAENTRQQMADELETLKFTVDKVASDERATRAEVGRLKHDLAERKKRLAIIQRQCEQNRKQLEDSTKTTLDSESIAQEVEVLIAEKEESLRQLQKELDKQHGLKFKRSQELFELRGNRENIKAELQGSKFAYRNLGSKLRKVDEETRKQEDLIYTQDFTIQQLDGKVARLEGERTNDEKLLLEKQIKELTGRCEDQKSIETVLNIQLKKINDDIRRLTAEAEASSRETEKLTGKIQEIELHNDNAQRELKKLVTDKQDRQVENNILKLSLRNRRKQMNAKVDTVQTLEIRQAEMQAAMDERRLEVRNNKDVLETSLRACNLEKSKFSMDLHDRQQRIDKLRKRYEITTMSMGSTGEDGEEAQSSVYYIIKAAQEKEELQRQGDALDAKLATAERELIALENTLELLTTSNSGYRHSLNPVQPTDKEAGYISILEGRLDAAMDKFKVKRKQMKEATADMEASRASAAEVSQHEAMLIEQVGVLRNTLQHCKKEKDDQLERKERAERMTSKFKKDLRDKNKDKFEDVERDIAAREVRDFNLTIMEALGKLAKDEPSITDTIYVLCSQMQLPPPPAPVASGGSRSSSLASSRQSSNASSRSSSLSSTRSTGSGAGRVTRIEFGDGDALSSSSSTRSVGGRGSTGSLHRPPHGAQSIPPSSSRSGSARRRGQVGY